MVCLSDAVFDTPPLLPCTCNSFQVAHHSSVHSPVGNPSLRMLLAGFCTPFTPLPSDWVVCLQSTKNHVYDDGAGRRSPTIVLLYDQIEQCRSYRLARWSSYMAQFAPDATWKRLAGIAGAHLHGHCSCYQFLLHTTKLYPCRTS